MQSLSNSSALQTRAAPSEKRFVFGILALVVILLSIGILRHEMWRDELQAWCLARDSATLFEVHQHLLYEGHPMVWYLPLFAITRVTHNPFVMQILNVVLASAASYLVLAFAPFSKWQRALFCLGYFPLFEYGIFSRSYSLELFVILAFCALFRQRTRHPWWLFLTLTFLASVNAYGLMIAFALTATLILEYWIERKANPFPIKIVAIGSALVLLSAIVTLFQISAPADGYHSEPSAIKEKQPNRLFKALRAIPVAYAPIPNMSEREFWNTELISKIGNEPITDLLIAAVSLLCIALLCTTLSACFLYVIGTGGLVLFSYTHLLGGLRQQGHLFIILFCSLWLAHFVSTKFVNVNWLSKISNDRNRSLFLSAVLILQLIAGIYAYSQDLMRPFSSAKLVARFIQQKGLADQLIIGTNDHEMTSVSGYLDKKIFCPESNTYASFVVNNTSRHNIEFEELSSAAKAVMTTQHVNEALLILNYPLGAVPQGFKVECLNVFDKSIQGDERFYLYKIIRI